MKDTVGFVGVVAIVHLGVHPKQNKREAETCRSEHQFVDYYVGAAVRGPLSLTMHAIQCEKGILYLNA